MGVPTRKDKGWRKDIVREQKTGKYYHTERPCSFQEVKVRIAESRHIKISV